MIQLFEHRIRILLSVLLCAAVFTSGADDGIPLVTSKELSGTDHIRKLVRFEGWVTDVFKDESNPEYYFMTLEDDLGTVYFSAHTNNFPLWATDDYVGCRVSITGWNAPAIEKTQGTRQYLFNELQLQENSRFTVLDRPKADPFDAKDLTPALSIPPGDLHRLGSRKLTGRVLAVRTQNEILMQTSNDTVSHVTVRRSPLPLIGDFIEAVGTVETDTYFLNLTRARWRRTHSFSVSEHPPLELTAPQIMKRVADRNIINTKLHGRTIRIRSVVHSLPDPGIENMIIFAESGGMTFPIDAGACPSVVQKIERGATVDATGICWIEIENWRPTAVFPQAKGFSLVLRSADDIRVVSTPSWWTPARLLIVIGALMMVITAVLIWNTALQRAAKRQGRRLFREQAARLSAELKSKERSRLAVELHDSISQVLTGAALKIKAAQTMARTDLERSLANLSIAENSLRSSREELRYCLWDLRNNILDLPNFEEAVRQMLKPYIGDTELAVRLPVQRRKISESTAHEILKIIRELAVNAVRHGAATKIKIAGSLDGSTLAFSVKDNGCGFDDAAAPGPEQGHFGILGIKDRLAYYNGTLSIHGSPGADTKATVVMQIDAEQTEKSK